MSPDDVLSGDAARSATRRFWRGPDGSLMAVLAWSLAGLSIVMFVATVALGLAVHSAPSEGIWGTGGLGSVMIFAPFLAFPVVGTLIVSRHPKNPIGWICIADGFVWMLAIVTGPYAQYGLANPGTLPYPAAISALTTWLWVPGVGLFGVYLVLLFPNGRLPSPRWRLLALFAAAVMSVASVLFVVGPRTLEGLGDTRNPFWVGSYPWLGVVAVAVIAMFPPCILAAAASLVLRFRRSGREVRQQIKWLALAVILVGLAYLGTIVATLLFAPETMDSNVGPPTWLSLLQDGVLMTYAGVPIAVGVAVLRHRMFDVDVVVNRALVYGTLTAIVVGTYVVVVGYLGTLFRASGSFAVSLIAAGLVAVLFAPLRDHLQRGVNRLMYGERDDPYAVVSRLGRRLEATLAPDAVLPVIVETLRDALKLPYAAIRLGEGEPREASASVGTSVAEPLRLPLHYGNETVGELLVGPRAGEPGFSEADLRLLSDLALQAGVAAHAVRLTGDLQRSRERLVSAREEERRRLRRDLHDGLGAQLAGLNAQAGVLRNLIRQDPKAADALVVELRAEMRAAISDIRRLVHDLRPPALDELGTIDALERLVERYGAAEGGLRVSFQAPDAGSLPPLPAAVEVAIYRIAQEAMTNVLGHAQARSCVVRLSVREEVVLEVADDGVGIPDERPAGVGLHSMRERAEELGGSCSVERIPGGGTRVLARLPLHPQRNAVVREDG